MVDGNTKILNDIISQIEILYNIIQTTKMRSDLPGNPHIYAMLNLLKFWFTGAKPEHIKGAARDLVRELRKLNLID